MSEPEQAQPESETQVAIVGGGISGLACAATLSDHGVRSIVFDRGRRVGGRMSSRISIHNEVELEFDHGAPKAEIRTKQFAEFVDSLVRYRVAETQFHQGRQVCSGIESNQAIPQHLAQGLRIHVSTEVESIQEADSRWTLNCKQYDRDSSSQHVSTHIVFACPMTQAARVLDASALRLPGVLREHTGSSSCWSCMFLLESDADIPDLPRWIEPDQGAELSTISLQRASKNMIKVAAQQIPNTNHVSNDDHRSELISAALLEIQPFLIGKIDSYTCRALDLHRWGLAFPINTRHAPFYLDVDSQLGFCGDTFAGDDGDWAGIEAAYLSGVSLGNQIHASICQKR